MDQLLLIIQQKFGDLKGLEITEKILELAMQFLHEHPASDKKKEKTYALDH